MLATIIFGIFSGILLLSSGMVVLTNQTIYSVLWLVLAFMSAAALWVSLSAEFLGLMLVLVYVGAVLTLFLFIIMTLSTTPRSYASAWQHVSHYGISASVTLIGLGTILYALCHQPSHLSLSPKPAMATQPLATEDNTQMIGIQLYTDYLYPFELAGVLLLIAVVVSIALHSNSQSGQKNSPKPLSKQEQIRIKREERIQLVKGDK
jgi:NADH-quinone oxidoreductase subunit J